MGRIAYLTSRVDSGKTPIAREIDHFIAIIGIVATIIGILFFTSKLKIWLFKILKIFSKKIIIYRIVTFN